MKKIEPNESNHAHNFKHIETMTKHKPPIKTYIVMMCDCGTVMVKEVKFE